MSNLVGDCYNDPCPYCGRVMGNAAPLGRCSVCEMAPPKLAQKSVDFLTGFEGICLPFVRGAMMKPYRIRTHYEPSTDTLHLVKEMSWSLHNFEDLRETDDSEYHPASDPNIQVEFLSALNRAFKAYNDNLAICCIRRKTDGPVDTDIGIYPLEPRT